MIAYLLQELLLCDNPVLQPTYLKPDRVICNGANYHIIIMYLKRSPILTIGKYKSCPFFCVGIKSKYTQMLHTIIVYLISLNDYCTFARLAIFSLALSSGYILVRCQVEAYSKVLPQPALADVYLAESHIGTMVQYHAIAPPIRLQ